MLQHRFVLVVGACSVDFLIGRIRPEAGSANWASDVNIALDGRTYHRRFTLMNIFFDIKMHLAVSALVLPTCKPMLQATSYKLMELVKKFEFLKTA